MASSSSSSSAHPKRAGDHSYGMQPADIDDPASKKPRFDPRNPSTLLQDADEEIDPALEADVIGKGAGVKRNAVNIDGYDSDSSTENFDVRAEARSKMDAPADDEDDDDMFADDKGKEKAADSSKSHKDKKKPRFLEDNEIEGQEFTSKSGGHVAADLRRGSQDTGSNSDSSSESGDDEMRDRLDPDMDEELGAGGKKKHAPRLDAFNMRAEQEEGRFDEAGNYVRKAYDPDAAQDQWLDGITKKDIKRAKEAHDKREAEQKAKAREEDSLVTSDLLATLIRALEKGETPLEALARYNKAIPPKKKTSNNNWAKKKMQTMDVVDEPDPAKSAAAIKAQKAIKDITDCASVLGRRGFDDVDDVPRESLTRHYKRETGEDWKDRDPEPVKWEFHWVNAPKEDIHGPYDTANMRTWEEQGHFARAAAEFRRVGQTEWADSLDLDEDT